MDQEKIGKLIRDIRKKNNLTQAEFANKYSVTYQAVSKWENGKNIPDVSLLKKMSEDFNIDLESILEGEFTPREENKNNKARVTIITSLILLAITIIILLIINIFKDDNFEFKTLTSSCKNFNISGSMAYNSTKSSIYISDITYCGGDDTTDYKKIECILYESHSNNEIKKISEFNYESDKTIKLEEFMKQIKFNIDNYETTCKDYTSHSLYFLISATNTSDEITTYKVPLSLEDNCKKE